MRFTTLVALLTLSLPAVAQDNPAPANATQNTTSVPAPAQGTLNLSDVLTLTEANHPRLQGSRAEQQAASARRLSTQGAFDPVVSASTDSLRYNSTSTRGRDLTTSMSDATVELPFRNGVRVFAGGRLNLANPKSPVSSTGDTGEWHIGVKAPLLRGFNLNPQAVREQQALIGEPIAAQQFAATRLNVLLEAAQAYWIWVGSGQKADVARELLRTAQVRAAQIRRRFELGDLPEFDVIDAEREVQRREGAAIQAERAQQTAAFRLSLYLWGDTDTAQSTLPAPTQAPTVFPPVESLSPDAVLQAQARAEQERPEVQAVRLTQQQVNLDERLAQNDRQPTLDFVVNPGLDTGRKSIGTTFKAGVVFAVPIYLREATGRRDEARFRQEKLRQDERLLMQQARIQVADAANAVEQARRGILVAEEEVRLAEDVQAKEIRRYELGEGTLFLVNQRERETAEARQRLIDALAVYQQAIAAYRAASLQL